LPESLPVPSLAALGERVDPTHFVEEPHVDHGRNHSEELVSRCSCRLLEPLEVHTAFSLQMLGDLELPNGSSFSARHDIATIGTKQIALDVISSYFSAAADWTRSF